MQRESPGPGLGRNRALSKGSHQTLSGKGQAPQRQHQRAVGGPEAPANSTGSHGSRNSPTVEAGPATAEPEQVSGFGGRARPIPATVPFPRSGCRPPGAEIREVSTQENKVTGPRSSLPRMWSHFSKNQKLLHLHLCPRAGGRSACRWLRGRRSGTGERSSPRDPQGWARQAASDPQTCQGPVLHG